MHDKCKKNTCEDIEVINMRDGYTKTNEPPQLKECNTFVYAAFLPPGMHQFLIYCPKTHRLFCKDIIIDLNSFDDYPEFPEVHKPVIAEVKKVKKTRANVWRKWRYDSKEDITKAFLLDINGPQSTWEPELFLKNEEDLQNCQDILFDHFEMIQVFYLEGLIDSASSYPEISSSTFL